VHFLAYAENDLPLTQPAWLDTVNVPYRGTVDVILDFTDPVIKGMSVFHCHLLSESRRQGNDGKDIPQVERWLFWLLENDLEA
jgi:hypothetical protein